MYTGMTRIGDANARFAKTFLGAEKIPVLRIDVGGNMARRIDFDPVMGRTRCRIVERVAAPAPRPVARPQTDGGELELF